MFSTGDELSEPSDNPGAGRIVDANRPMLNGIFSSMGCDVHDCGILRDNPETQIASLLEAARNHDLIVTSGSMSVGEEDHLARVIERRGYLEVWKLNIKPGKPVGIADIDDCPILALRGNPIAAAITSLLLGTPMVARLSGNARLYPERLKLPLSGEIAKRFGRWEALLATLVCLSDGRTAAMPLPKSGSAMLSALAEADGFIALPEEADLVPEGTVVEFVPIPK